MNKVYIFLPLLALVGFSFYYHGFAKDYAAAQVAKDEAVREKHHQELLKDAADRETAIKAALELNTQRKAEKAAKEAKELAEKETRLAANEARNEAQAQRSKFASQVKSLNADIDAVTKEIADIETDKKRLNSEIDFLKTYVTAAQQNRGSLQAVMQKINEADAAQAAATAAAAAAAKK